MTATTVMASLCIAAIAFNVRFLMALRAERKAVSIKIATLEQRKNKPPVARAAWKGTEVAPTHTNRFKKGHSRCRSKKYQPNN